jgi:hypothetical protein
MFVFNVHTITFLILLTFLSYYQKRAILPYVLFLVTVAMCVGRMEPTLAQFGQAVSEEKICLTISQSETRIALGGHICWRNGTK